MCQKGKTRNEWVTDIYECWHCDRVCLGGQRRCDDCAEAMPEDPDMGYLGAGPGS